jgi:hypothetical protein
LKKQDDADVQRGSGLFIGSEPIKSVYDRRASGKGDDDSKDGDTGDDDSTDSDKADSDTIDTGDRGDSRDSDGKD